MDADLASRIRQARIRAGLSQETLATRIGTKRRNILRWEGGYNVPRAAHMAAIAKATGVSVDSLLNDDEDDEEADLHAALAHALKALARHEAERAREQAA